MPNDTGEMPVDQDRANYIEDMLTAFEHDEPGIAEAMALYDDAARNYAAAIQSTPQEVWRITSQSTSEAL